MKKSRVFLWTSVLFWMVIAAAGMFKPPSVQAADLAQLDTSIQFIKPSGSGVALLGGQQYTIKWDAAGSIAQVAVYYSDDGGVSWNLIDKVSGNPGTYLWQVPMPTGQYVDAALKLVICRSSWEGIPPALVLRYYYNISDSVRIANPYYIFPPGNLTAQPLSSTSIKLAWNDNSSKETGFAILQVGSGGTLTEIARVGADTTSYVVEGLSPNTEYFFKVYGFNDHYSSSTSNTAGATTLSEMVLPVPPQGPSHLVATPYGKDAIYLDWLDNASDETSFIVERSLYPDRGFAEIEVLSADTVAYKNTGLNPGTGYYFRVKARNSAGDSGYSNIAGAKTLSETNTPGDAEIKEDEEGKKPSSVKKAIVMRFYIDSRRYYVDDLESTLDTAPVILNSRTLLPIRYVAEPLGARVSWDPGEKKVAIKRGEELLELWIDRNTARVNGVNKLIDPENPRVTPVIMPPGRTMMPLRFIAESLGCEVGWDSRTREVCITYKGME